MRPRQITIKPDGTVHVRTYLRAGATPLKQLFGVEEAQRGGLETNSNTPVSENTAETVDHSYRRYQTPKSS